MKTLLQFVFLVALSAPLFAGESGSSLDEAKSMAASQNKPLLIEFYHPS